jgi:hypothetical protein
MMDFKNRPKGWGRLDVSKTFDWKKFQKSHTMLNPVKK